MREEGWDSSQIRKQSASPVVSIPAAMWSRDSAAMSICPRGDWEWRRWRRVKGEAWGWAAVLRTKESARGVSRGLRERMLTIKVLRRRWRRGE